MYNCAHFRLNDVTNMTAIGRKQEVGVSERTEDKQTINKEN